LPARRTTSILWSTNRAFLRLRPTTAVLSAVFFVLAFFIAFGVAYWWPVSLVLLARCVYATPDCSLAAATWVLAAITGGALVAAIAAFLVEVRPQLTMRRLSVTAPPAQTSVDIFVVADGDNTVDVLVGDKPANALGTEYQIARFRFANVGRSPLLELVVELKVERAGTVLRSDRWDGTPRTMVERHRHWSHVPLDHLTSGDDESRRAVEAVVHLDPELVREGTNVEWTGMAVTTTRRFRFARALRMEFALPPTSLE